MKKQIFLTFFFFASFIQLTSACSCGGGQATFCEGITDSEGNIRNDLIIRAIVTDKNNDGIKVQVEQVIFGDLEQDELFIPEGFGIDCSMSIDVFSKGKEYIFALWDRSSNDDYFLNICQVVNYLEIEDNIIKGKIAPGIESLKYEELGTLGDCGEGLNVTSLKKSISIFPNPTNDILKIKNVNQITSIELIQVEFVDMIGRQLFTFKKENGIEPEEVWFINLKDFSAGVYYLKLIGDRHSTICKIIKQ